MCSGCPVLTGKDAKQLLKAMKNAKPVSKAKHERARKIYEAVNANSEKKRMSKSKSKTTTNLTYLGSTPIYSLEDTEAVYMVVSLRFDKGAHIHSEKRTWGWLPTLEHARKSVAMNSGDMHEMTFNYVLIEKVPAGICVMNELVDVYKWKPDETDENHWRGKWVKCRKPKWTEGVINWTVG